MNHTTGTHCILELFECPFEVLDDENIIREAVEEAAAESGSTLLALTSHHFDPQGATALGLLAESHISIHTWPETGYAAADVFTCGKQCNPRKACSLLIEKLKSRRHSLSVLQRGPEKHFPNVIDIPKAAKQNRERPCPGSTIPTSYG